MGKRMSSEVERVCRVFETLMEDYRKRFSDFEKAYTNENERAQSLGRYNLTKAEEERILEHI